MITRDPLPVPCRTEGYWATFSPEDKEPRLARIQDWIVPGLDLPQESSLSDAVALELEERLIRECLDR
jgi:hypothetical protein